MTGGAGIRRVRCACSCVAVLWGRLKVSIGCIECRACQGFKGFLVIAFSHVVAYFCRRYPPQLVLPGYRLVLLSSAARVPAGRLLDPLLEFRGLAPCTLIRGLRPQPPQQ